MGTSMSNFTKLVSGSCCAGPAYIALCTWGTYLRLPSFWMLGRCYPFKTTRCVCSLCSFCCASWVILLRKAWCKAVLRLGLDGQGRTPLDLLSTSLKAHLISGTTSEVYSWGNGANYQLGTEAEGLQLTPNRLDSLHGTSIIALAAAKFHSAAVAEDGSLYTWGFGRGGRLGALTFHQRSNTLVPHHSEKPST